MHETFSQELSTIKHNTLVLRNENIEIKQYLMELTKSRYELDREVKLLKDVISQLIEQQTIFNDSLIVVDKDIKNLKRENMQSRSKYDILHFRFKSFQDSKDQNYLPKTSLPPTLFGQSPRQIEKESPRAFPMSPRLDNIVNKSTRNRLESLMKDLETVFTKRTNTTPRLETLETGKDEKETIMEEWSNPSELNTSQTHSEKSQFTVVTHHPGDVPYESLGVLGYPSSLMDQLEMLNLQQGSPKNEDRMLESAVSFGDTSPKTVAYLGIKSGNTPKSKGSKYDHFGRTSPIVSEHPSPGKSGSSSQANHFGYGIKDKLDTGSILDEIKKPQQMMKTFHDAPQTSNIPKLQMQSITASTIIGTQNSLESYSNFSMYSNNEGLYQPQKYEVAKSTHSPNSADKMILNPNVETTFSRNSTNTGSSETTIKNFGTMDVKKKKELYLKGDNMLIGVLDKLEEQKGGQIQASPLRQETGPVHFHTEPSRGTDYRFIDHTFHLPQKYGDPGLQDVDKNFMKKNSFDTSIISNSSEISSTGTISSNRGVKKLKLVRRNMKSENFTGLQ